MCNTKVRFIKTFLVSLMFMCFCIACGQSNKNRSTTIWPNTVWFQLTQEMIKLRLPSSFKRSSRHRLEQDLPSIARDSIRLTMMQNALEMLEFEDAEIDLFVDTTKDNRLVIVSNFPKFNITTRNFASMKEEIVKRNENDRINNPEFLYSDIGAQMKSNAQHTLARYTKKITNRLDLSDIYHSIYYLTGSSYSLMIYEFSEDDENIERCLWSTKVGQVSGN